MQDGRALVADFLQRQGTRHALSQNEFRRGPPLQYAGVHEPGAVHNRHRLQDSSQGRGLPLPRRSGELFLEQLDQRKVQMFTGIVRGLCPVVSVERYADSFSRILIHQSGELLAGLKRGDSVSVDGVCLTVTSIREEIVSYDVIYSTLSRTTIGEYVAGRLVNIERSMLAGAEIGGHEVSGHVDTTATVERIETTMHNRCIFFRQSEQYGRYLFPRGFVAVNGVSLTVSDCLDGGSLFSVWLIPETIATTNIGSVSVGAKANIEIHRGVQVIVDSVEAAVGRFLKETLDSVESGATPSQNLQGLVRALLPSSTSRPAA
jgi:riboflavin synthase